MRPDFLEWFWDSGLPDSVPETGLLKHRFSADFAWFSLLRNLAVLEPSACSGRYLSLRAELVNFPACFCFNTLLASEA